MGIPLKKCYIDGGGVYHEETLLPSDLDEGDRIVSEVSSNPEELFTTLPEEPEEGELLLPPPVETMEDVYDHLHEEKPEEVPIEGPAPTEIPEYKSRTRYKIKYSDNWKILAARGYSAALKVKAAKVLVWTGDNLRLSDPIPPSKIPILRKEGLRNTIRFSKIANLDAKLRLLWERTFWGVKLKRISETKNPYPGPGPVPDELYSRQFAGKLVHRIKTFLKGGMDPSLSKEKKIQYFGADNLVSDPKLRSERFLQLLRTVDGCFVQRYLAFPEEVWSWDKYDSFTIMMIHFLLGDEFMDCELKVDPSTIETSYAKLKAIRKAVKLAGHSRRFEDVLLPYKDVPELSYWSDMLYHLQVSKGPRYVRILGILSQTRGAGTPPNLVVLQSKLKFLRVVTEDDKDPSPTALAMVKASCDLVISRIGDENFTGLSTKARVQVASTACLEHTREEGGTVQAIKEIVSDGTMGRRVPIRNLDTGKVESQKTFYDLTPGEYIFWSCLDKLIKTSEDDVSTVFMVLVKEPGKARTVTKGPAYAKVILDFAGRLASWPLKRGLESSESGMGRANQAWQFFKLVLTNYEKEIFFTPIEVKEEKFYDHVERLVSYAKVYMSSTDYVTATDSTRHVIAKVLSERWMVRCGLPRVIREIVTKVSYRPRKVFFSATGWLKNIGTVVDETTNYVITRRGILMGDPMTKPILHLINAGIRILPELPMHPGFLARYATNAAQVLGVLSKVHPKSKKKKQRSEVKVRLG